MLLCSKSSSDFPSQSKSQRSHTMALSYLSVLTSFSLIPFQQPWPPCQSSNTSVTFPSQTIGSCFFSCLECPKCLLFCFFINIDSLFKLWPSQYGLSLPHNLIMKSWSHNTFICELLEFCGWILKDVSACVHLQAFYFRRMLQTMNLSSVMQCKE